MQHVDPYGNEAKKQKIALLVGVGVLVLAALVGFGISALGINKGKDQVALAQDPGDPSPVLPAVVAEPDPALPIEKPADIQMPDDVYNWLEHLRRTDERLTSETNAIGMTAGIDRVSGLADMYGKALDGNLEDYTPRTESDKVNQKTDSAFADLATYFDSVPPPAECRPIYNAYKISLSETEANIHKIQELTSQAFATAMSGDGNPNAVVDDLKTIYADHKDGIDEHRRLTDNGVQQICDKYRTRKWFGIKPDPANPIMKGMVDMLLSSMGN